MSVEQRWNSLLKRLFEDEKKNQRKLKKKTNLRTSTKKKYNLNHKEQNQLIEYPKQ